MLRGLGTPMPAVKKDDATVGWPTTSMECRRLDQTALPEMNSLRTVCTMMRMSFNIDQASM
jgi:hypothetical protein